MSSRPQQPSSRSSPLTPKTIKLSPHALLSLPYRLTHPPPPQPKSSSWGITPHFSIPLEEILDRKHLPPLGLKDFEEWLLYIDRMPECLYFILWLREYKVRYTNWRRQSKLSSPIRCSSNPDARTYRSLSLPPPPNPALTQFYIRAKETFLTPYAPYALPLPLDVLAPFYSSLDAGLDGARDQLLVPGLPPSPPDPEIFDEVEERVISMLSNSLDRFVVATFHNVGMPRAYCGCAGGTVIGLTGSAPILLANFLTGGSRWWRFSALPGLWLGMTIVISAMYGVCMMIYVFGDLRQLRSFELARLPGSVQSSFSAKPGKDTKSKLSSNVFARMTSFDRFNRKDGSHQHTGPTPPLMQESTTADSTVVPESPTSRTPPPKLHLEPPAPAYTFTHIQTSSRSQTSHAHMQSISSASTSYSMRSHNFPSLPPPHRLYDDDDDYSSSGSEYDSDYETDSDTGSDASHVTVTETHTDVDLPGKATLGRRRARRRRRREPQIHISDAFYDEEPSPEGPAMGPISEGSRRSSLWGDSCEEDITTGATFIHPFRWDDAEEPSCTHDVEAPARCASEHQRIDAFDFDGLPRRGPRHSRVNSIVASLPSPTTPTFASPAAPPLGPPTDPEKQRRGVHFASDVEGDRARTASDRPLGKKEIPPGPMRKFLGILQHKCGPRNVVMYMLGGQRASTPTIAETDDMCERSPDLQLSQGPISPTSTLGPPSVVWPTSSIYPVSEKTVAPVPKTQAKMSWQKRVRRMLQVPAFASPLTPVLNPVVTRGQWEIVVRSAVIALMLSTVIIGALVGVPETRVV